MKYPSHLLKLFNVLRKLPGVGTKSAERFAFHLIHWPSSQLNEMAEILKKIPDNLKGCPECGCLLDEEKGCFFCHNSARDKTLLCLIASPKDVYAMEETREYKGLYHVLGGLLSPLDGKGPEVLRLPTLKKRLSEVQELIIALDSTLEGDATALYLKKELEPLVPHISRLAFGLPMGSSLEYVDGGTLARALCGRRVF